MRAHRDFHKSRIHVIPGIWYSITTRLRTQELEPLNLQAVSRQLFDSCMKTTINLLKRPDAMQPSIVRFQADEENAIRYASGYVAMKI